MIIWIWIVSGLVALITTALAVLRMRAWWKDRTMRLLIVFLVGVCIHSIISVYLSGAALGGQRVQFGVEFLTFGQLCMLIPATALAIQILGIFDTSPRESTP